MCVGARRMCATPKAFLEDGIRVYGNSDVSMAQVAKVFGISPSSLRPWLSIDERKSSSSTGSATPGESDVLR